MAARNLGLLSNFNRVVTKLIGDDQVTLDKMAHATAGDVLLYDATGVPILLNEPAKDGRVLQSKPGANLVEWASFADRFQFDTDAVDHSASSQTRHTITWDFSDRTSLSTILLFYNLTWSQTTVGLSKFHAEIWRGAVGGGTELINRPYSPDSAIANANSATLLVEEIAAPAASTDYNFHLDHKGNTWNVFDSWALSIDLGEN